MKKLILILTIALFVVPRISLADWGHRPGYHGSHTYYHWHNHPYWGYHVNHFYPYEYYPIWVGGTRYYYDDGVYYDYVGGTYVVAEPPVGAIVSSIPSDFQPVVANGITYYTNNGTYYVYTPSGYKVVAAPAIPAPAGSQNTFIINVPRYTGGYVQVTLRKSGNGYVGPQGEFYTAFPAVAELKTMYGR